MVLINTVVCTGIEYIAALANFEDIAFNRELLLHRLETLKVRTYAGRFILRRVAARPGASLMTMLRSSIPPYL